MKKTAVMFLLPLALLFATDWAWMSAASAQSASPQRGGFMAQRQRLVTELQLDVQQQARLDAITSEMLPKYLALRGMSQAERAPARARLTEEAQQKINAMLTPDQRASYELMQAKKEADAAHGAAPAPKSAASTPSPLTAKVAGV